MVTSLQLLNDNCATCKVYAVCSVNKMKNLVERGCLDVLKESGQSEETSHWLNHCRHSH
jgi:hypothetical protein